MKTAQEILDEVKKEAADEQARAHSHLAAGDPQGAVHHLAKVQVLTGLVVFIHQATPAG